MRPVSISKYSASVRSFSLGGSLKSGHLGKGGIDGLFPLAEPVLLNPDPAFLSGLVVGVRLARQFPQALPSVKSSDNPDRSGEVLTGQVPDPLGAVARHHLRFTAARGAGDGRGAKVAQPGNLPGDRLAAQLQIRRRMGHEGPPESLIRTDFGERKEPGSPLTWVLRSRANPLLARAVPICYAVRVVGSAASYPVAPSTTACSILALRGVIECGTVDERQ